MYTLMRLISWKSLLQQQIPACAASFVIAEIFYKFHSFALETLAFLATWFVIDAAIQGARVVVLGSKASAIDPGN